MQCHANFAASSIAVTLPRPYRCVLLQSRIVNDIKFFVVVNVFVFFTAQTHPLKPLKLISSLERFAEAALCCPPMHIRIAEPLKQQLKYYLYGMWLRCAGAIVAF